MQNVREEIKARLYNDEGDWCNPYWIDEVKEKFPDIASNDIDNIYAEELKAKVASLSTDELAKLYNEQMDKTDANQNFLLQELIEQRTNSN